MKPATHDKDKGGMAAPLNPNKACQKLALVPASGFILFSSLLSLSAQDDIRPSKSLISKPFWETPTPWILLGVTVTLILALVIWLRWRARRPATPEKIISAYEEALSGLEKAKPFMERGEDKAFSIAVSNTIRRYIERTFAIAAPEQTTEEFLEAAAQHPQLNGEPLDRLAGFLELCDRAKFAQQAFGDSQRQAQFDHALQFVEQSEAQKPDPKNPRTSTPAPAPQAQQPPTLPVKQ